MKKNSNPSLLRSTKLASANARVSLEKGRCNKAFTLVELIVVITILVILGTIAFISLQLYSRDARNSVRVTDLEGISRQLEFMLVKAGQVYMPENKVDITASGTIITYQGEMGQNILNKLRISNGGLDPVDQTPYIYTITKNLKQYELMGFLEGGSIAYTPNSISINGEEVSLNNFSFPFEVFKKGIIPQANAATNLKNRYPTVKGDNIGILLDTVTKEPINLTGVGVDIVNTTNTYTVYLNNSSNGSDSGTGNILKIKLSHVINRIGSCNSILKNGGSKGSGIYKINPTGNGNIEVYCDMTTDGGG